MELWLNKMCNISVKTIENNFSDHNTPSMRFTLITLATGKSPWKIMLWNTNNLY